jgi:type II secretory pathway pseudopilin PulG
MTISLVFSLIGIAAAIVAIVLAKRTHSEVHKATVGEALMIQRLEDLYRAAAEVRIDPGQIAAEAPRSPATTDGLGATASGQSAGETPHQPSIG